MALAAASMIDSVRAVVAMAAPATPGHIKRHIADDLAVIELVGEAQVALAGRLFTIRKQLLDDIERVRLDEAIATLRRPLLVLHSPVDNVVDIENAMEILGHACHPKSFISLDDADHMISDDHDAQYIA